MALTDEQKARFARSLLVEGFTPQHMELLLTSRIAVVGAGGLGSAALYYLVAAGVGNVRIIEDDILSTSNLQRQILYTTSQINSPKAQCAAMRLSQLNPMCNVSAFETRLEEGNCEELLSGSDIVLDCTDNYRTRYVIDDFCSAASIPMIYGTAQDGAGQVSVFHWGKGGSYRDLYPQEPLQKAEVGVMPPVPGIIGSVQAMEAIKIICGLGEPLDGRLLTIDAFGATTEIFEI